MDTNSCFSRMVSSCYTKCVTKYGESDLSVAESSCLDRCVVKFIQAQTAVSMLLFPNFPKNWNLNVQTSEIIQAEQVRQVLQGYIHLDSYLAPCLNNPRF
jgi:hypothetical protein